MSRNKFGSLEKIDEAPQSTTDRCDYKIAKPKDYMHMNEEKNIGYVLLNFEYFPEIQINKLSLYLQLKTTQVQRETPRSSWIVTFEESKISGFLADIFESRY